MNELKYRNELKYICTEAELRILEARISAICRKDPHVGSSGTYDIRSIYFDDVNDTCFKDNESGVDPRAKYRIRIYNGDASRITLEKKIKSHSMTRKISAQITQEQFDDIMSGRPRGIYNISGESISNGNATNDKVAKDKTSRDGNLKLLNEFETLMYTKGYRPKTVVVYERTPFIYNVGNVRITLDRNIGYTNKLEIFFDDKISTTPVLANGTHVLEVKYDELLPNFIYESLHLNSLMQINFSKYYLSRRRM